MRLLEHPGHADQKAHGRRGGASRPAIDLRNGKVENVTRLPGGSMNPCFTGTIGGQQVFIKMPSENEVRKEVVAFELNELGGGLVRMVPTARRDDIEPSSTQRLPPVIVQEFVTGDRIGDTDWRSRVGSEEFNDIAVFDFVTSNRDRHLANAMVDANGTVIAVDHGLSLDGGAQFREYLYPRYEQDLTDRQIAFCERIATASRAHLGSLGMHGDEIDEVQQRAQYVLDNGNVPRSYDWYDYDANYGRGIGNPGSSSAGGWSPSSSPAPSPSTWRARASIARQQGQRAPKFGTRAFRTVGHDTAQHQMRKAANITVSTTPPQVATPTDTWTAPGQQRLFTAVMQEHGSHDQKSHGRRGARMASAHGDWEHNIEIARIEDIRLLGGGIHESFVGTAVFPDPEFDGDDTELQVAIKPVDGGFFHEEGQVTDANRELGAVITNDYMGSPLRMPRVVIRDVEGLGECSVTEWVYMGQTSREVRRDAFIDDDEYAAFREEIAPELVTMGMVDMLIGNGDRNPGNWMVVGAYGSPHVYPIDHGSAFTGSREGDYFSATGANEHVRLPKPAGTPHYVPAPTRELAPHDRQALETLVSRGREYVAEAGPVIGAKNAQRVVDNAKALLQTGKYEYPEADWQEDDFYWQTRLDEARLREHGDHDQSTHGRRGKFTGPSFKTTTSAEPPLELSSKGRMAVDIENGEVEGLYYLSGDPSVNPTYSATIDGQTVFVKHPNDRSELDFEMAAQSLNDFGGGLVNIPRTARRWLDNPMEGGRHEHLVSEYVNGMKIKYALQQGKIGSVEDNPDLHDMAVFDFVSQNTDRHMGNAMVDVDGKVWAVDHGLSFVSNYHRDYLYPKTGHPLTPKQRSWLERVAEPTDVNTGPLSMALRGLGGDDVARVQARAKHVLDVGEVPTGDWDWNTGFEVQGRDIFGEAALLEHPGHSDQKVHGRWSAAAERVGLARSVKGGFEPDFASERHAFAPEGPPDGFRTSGRTIERRGQPSYSTVEVGGYDRQGKLVSTFSVARGGDQDGYFKITVRPGAERQGHASRLLDHVQDSGVVDLVAVAPRNAYTREGRALLQSWLTRRGETVTEARLKEHPGHADQKVHGRRGDAAVNLMGKIEDVEYFSEQGNMSTTYTLRIGPHAAFAKQANSEDLMRELGAQAVNNIGGGLVNIPRSVLRTDPEAVAQFDRSEPVMVMEFIDGQRASRAPGFRLTGPENAEALDDIQTFDFITGGSDRHLGNMLVDAKGKVWCVDQAWSFSDDLRGGPSYTAGAPGRPLSARQRSFAQTLAAMDPLPLAKAARIPVPKAARVIWRARTVLAKGTIPTGEDKRTDAALVNDFIIRGHRPEGYPDYPEKYNFDFFQNPVPISEARLKEHPGHAPQSVHGHRGSGPMPDWRRGRGTRWARRKNPHPLDPIYDAYKVREIEEEGRWDTVDGVDPYGSGHKTTRDGGWWGSSHGTSKAIRNESAHLMGIDTGHERPTGPRGGVIPEYNSRARKFLDAISGDQLGAEEPLYHGFDNARGIKFKPGDTLDLPLTASAGNPDTVSYGIRGWGPPKTARIEAERMGIPYRPSRPTLYAFPKGTPMSSYSKWPKEDARGFGYVHSEALVAGRFRVKAVHEDVKGVASAWWNPGVTVVELEPVETFDTGTGSWRPTETKLLGSEPWRPPSG